MKPWPVLAQLFFLRRLPRYFVRGLLVIAPVGITVYICYVLVSWVDGLLTVGIPGAGLLVAIVGITLIGAIAGNLVTRTLLTLLEGVMERLPFVRLLYTSTRDLLNAFVGEQRRFTRPVRVRLDEVGRVWCLGFLTAEALEHLGLTGHVAVYLPQSYNFAGQLIVVPAEQVQPLEADSADAMAFIVSGGVTGSAPAPPER